MKAQGYYLPDPDAKNPSWKEYVTKAMQSSCCSIILAMHVCAVRITVVTFCSLVCYKKISKTVYFQIKPRVTKVIHILSLCGISFWFQRYNILKSQLQ